MNGGGGRRGVMGKGSGMSDDSNDDFEPLTIRRSQVRPGKRKASGGVHLEDLDPKSAPNITPPVKSSPYFSTPNTVPIRSRAEWNLRKASLPSTSIGLTQRLVTDKFISGYSSLQSEDTNINTCVATGSEKGTQFQGYDSTIDNDTLLSCMLRTPDVPRVETKNIHSVITTSVAFPQATPDVGKVHSGVKSGIPGSSPANPLRIDGLIDEDDTVISSLKRRFDAEVSKIETFEDVTMAAMADDCFDILGSNYMSPSPHDVIEGPVQLLGAPVTIGFNPKVLRKAVDRDLDDVVVTSSRSGKDSQYGVSLERHGHDSTYTRSKSLVRDVKNSTETSTIAGGGSVDPAPGTKSQIARTSSKKQKTNFSRAMDAEVSATDEIDEENLWEEEFVLFANRKPKGLSVNVLQPGQPNVIAALEALKAVASKGQILHIEKLPARPAAYSDRDFKLPKKLQKAVQTRGIKKFYSHQAEAMDAVFNGSSIVAATPTASGKSMTYFIPVLDSLMKVPKSRALFIFPVKALARDQLKSLADLASEVKKGSHCFCYDGDTDKDQKSQIRKTGKIIITNPDMLHTGVLPNHKLWEQFFSNLKFVVIDEAHTYRGVFGSHVVSYYTFLGSPGCILRRLLRIARHYGSEPMFICCSATIGNPKEHVKRLTTVDMEVIQGSGAPTGEKHVVCWLPPETKDGDRRSVYKEAVKIVVALMKAGLQILVFVEARKLSESVCRLVREKLAQQRLFDLVDKVDSYRAGYTPEERIALEKRLQHGQLRALVTTRALELGIDVGHLDATVHVGLPNTMCSLWQQAGRAGRRQGASLAVILGRERPLDVFYMKNPKKLFERDVEHAFCNPCNPQVLRLQLPCAARELPLKADDGDYFGEAFMKSRDDLINEGVLQYRAGSRGENLYGYRFDDNPAFEISIRGTSSNCFQLLTGANSLVEEVDGKMALRMLYEGAIYPHARDTYRIKKLDIEKKQAFGELCDVHHITEVNAKTTVMILERISSRTTLGTRIHLGKLQVKEQVMGYCEIDVVKNIVVDNVNLKYPPSVFDTIGLWWDIPIEVMQKLKNMAYDALIVLRRVVLSLLPSTTMSDPTDILGLETLAHEQTEQPQIFVYDAYAGGIGLVEQAFKNIEETWLRALNVLQNCDCKFGCPVCTQSAHETVTNEADSSKHASIILLESLLCTRQISSIPAPDNQFGVPVEMEAVKTKSHALSPKSDSKLVNKVANQYLKSTTSVGYKKGPYVSSKTSRKCIGPTPSSVVGVRGPAVIDLS